MDKKIITIIIIKKMESTFHISCIPSSGTYQLEFEKFKIRNEELKDALFKAISESEDPTDQLLDSCIDTLLRIDRMEEELLKCIEEIIEMRGIIEFAFSKMSTFLRQPVNCTPIQSMVDFLFKEIEKTVFITMPTIGINWNLIGIPSLSISHNPYVFLSSPIWTNASRGKHENMFFFPCDILIDPTNGKIYTVDYNNSAIQVYSKNGVYENRFIHSEFKGPRKLAMRGEYLYIVVKTDVILKLNKEDGTILEEARFSFFIGGFDFWQDTLYAGDYRGQILHLIDESLKVTQKLIVEAICKKTETSKIGIQYVKTQSDGIYILFKFTNNFLQKFSYTGTLLNLFNPKEHIGEPWFFNLGPDRSIILSASASSKVRIYSQEGELLKSFEGSSENSPETICLPRGVVITHNYHIVVLNSKQTHCLQYF